MDTFLFLCAYIYFWIAFFLSLKYVHKHVSVYILAHWLVNVAREHLKSCVTIYTIEALHVTLRGVPHRYYANFIMFHNQHFEMLK